MAQFDHPNVIRLEGVVTQSMSKICLQRSADVSGCIDAMLFTDSSLSKMSNLDWTSNSTFQTHRFLNALCKMQGSYFEYLKHKQQLYNSIIAS